MLGFSFSIYYPRKLIKKYPLINFLFSKSLKERYIIRKLKRTKKTCNTVLVCSSLASRIEHFKVMRPCLFDLKLVEVEVETSFESEEAMSLKCLQKISSSTYGVTPFKRKATAAVRYSQSRFPSNKG